MHTFTVVLMWSDWRAHLLPSCFTHSSAGRNWAVTTSKPKTQEPWQHTAVAQASKAQKKFKWETSAGLTGLGAQIWCPTAPVQTSSASAATKSTGEKTEFELPGKSQGEQAPPLGADTGEYTVNTLWCAGNSVIADSAHSPECRACCRGSHLQKTPRNQSGLRRALQKWSEVRKCTSSWET